MEASESTSLIFKGISRIRTLNRKACVYSCIVILTIALCTLLLVCVGKGNSNAREDNTDQGIKDSHLKTAATDHSTLHYLVDILPASFAMTLRVFHKQAESWMPQDSQEILVEFNRYGCELRYRECKGSDNNKSGGLTSNLGDCVLVADGQSMFHISGESEWECFDNVESLSLYYIIQLGLNATPTNNKFSEPCHGRAWKVVMKYGDVVFCEDTGQLLNIHQNDMKAEVIHWTSPATEHIKVPHSSKQCTFKSISHSARLGNGKIAPNFKSVSTKSRGQVKDCLFVHGSGKIPETEPSTSYEILPEYKSYWGDIAYHTPQCKSQRFIRMNTVVHGWDHFKLHEQFCEFAAGKEKVVSEKIIFSHSMGNLIIAAALYRKVCSFDKNSTEWYSIQGPWKGSKAVDQLKSLCACCHDVLKKLGLNTYCTDDAKTTNLAYTSMRTDYISPTGITYTDLINTSRGLVNGVMCGDSAYGIGKKLNFSLYFNLVQWKSELGKFSDGLVALESCSAVGGTFQETFESPFYRGSFNHLEGTCIYGDASWTIFGNFKKFQPCKWISLR